VPTEAVSAAQGGVGHTPEPIAPELLTLLSELIAESSGIVRESLVAILDEYIVEWLRRLQPLPYVPNMAVEVATRRGWIPELVERLGASTIVEAMRLALEAVEGGDCASLLPRLVAIEEALLEASEVEIGDAIRSVLESSDCRRHAALIAQLIAIRPVGWGK
jgi:hypothetical protein